MERIRLIVELGRWGTRLEEKSLSELSSALLFLNEKPKRGLVNKVRDVLVKAQAKNAYESYDDQMELGRLVGAIDTLLATLGFN